MNIKKYRNNVIIKIGKLFDLLNIDSTNPIDKKNDFEILIKTPIGFKKIEAFSITEKIKTLTLYFKNGKTLRCARKHLIKTENVGWKYATDLDFDDIIITETGNTKLKFKKYNDKLVNLFDLQVNDIHCFYTNEILSHNSMILCELGKNAVLNGHTVVHYTLELYEHQVGIRYDSMISGLPINNVSENFDFIKNKLDKITGAGKLFIKEYPTKSATVNTIRFHLNKLLMSGIIPDLIIVDYADLLKSRRNYEQKRFELESIYEDLRSLAGEISTPIWSACFHGDTKIKLVDGREITFKEGVDLCQKEQLYVYSVNQTTKKMTVGKVKLIYKSGVNKKLFKVTLDNGESIIATENHKFILRNGEYRELKDLQIDDSLMPYYERNITGRKEIYNLQNWESNYKFIAKWKYNEIPKYYHIHHIDGNKLNDHPDNLVILTQDEHYAKHGYFRKKEEWINTSISSDMIALYSRTSNRMKYNNPMKFEECRKKMSKSRTGKCLGEENPMARKEVKDKVINSLTSSEKFIQHVKKLPNIVKNIWANRTTEEKQKISNKIQMSRFGMLKFDRILFHIHCALITNNIDEYLNLTKSISLKFKNKVWKICKNIPRKKHTEETKNKISISRLKRIKELGYINTQETKKKISETLKRKYTSGEIIVWNKKKKENNEVLNHKVKSIEFYGYDDVYNMEVEEHHNYALAAGIIVKNSQATRSSFDNEIVTLASIAESFAKAAVSDVIITLSRKTEDKLQGKGRLFIAKNRAGVDGILIPIEMTTSPIKIKTLPPINEENGTDVLSQIKNELNSDSNFVNTLAAKKYSEFKSKE